MSFYTFLYFTEKHRIVVHGFGGDGVSFLAGHAAFPYDIFRKGVAECRAREQQVVIEIFNVAVVDLLSVYLAYHHSPFESSFGGR